MPAGSEAALAVASKKHHRREPIVVDKHLDGDLLASIVGRRPISATTIRPTRAYKGEHADDEDYAHVLQLAWENEAALLSADGEMIAKALAFEKQYRKAEDCLRGVIVLGARQDEQVDALRRFVQGETVPIATRKGDVIPRSLDELEDYNIGLDLRQDPPRVVHLCTCKDD